jgi:cytochrome c553
MRFQSLALTAVLAAFSLAAQADGNAEQGKTKATVCVACHGIDGNSANPEWPRLAGQHASYIVKQLEAFKGGKRQNPLMAPLVANLSDQDMADLAAYFSLQTGQGGETNPSKVSQGQKLYRGGDAKGGVSACAACHGADGRGNPPALYPQIRGQHATYVSAQLHAYKAGTRKTDQNQIMQNVASALSDEQIDAVASYVQGLR